MAGEGKKRIIELPEATAVSSGDYFAIDSNANGTKKIPQSALPSKAEVGSIRNDIIVVSKFSAFSDTSDYIPFYVEFEQGRYNASGAKDDTSKAYRCRSVEILESAKYDLIIVDHTNKAYGVYVSYYDSSKTFVSQTNMQARGAAPYVINKQYPYFSIVCIDYSNNSYTNAIAPQECVENFYICKYNTERDMIYPIVNVLTESGYEPIKTTFENGRLEANGAPSNNPYATRTRTTDYYSTADVDYIVNSRVKNYLHYIFYYDTNKTFVTSTSGQATTRTAINKSYAYFKIVVLNYDNNSFDNAITPIEAAGNVMCVKDSVLSESLTETKHLKALDLQGIYPSYFTNQLSNARTAINNHMGAVGKSGTTFMFATDLHWTNNQKHSAALMVWLRNTMFVNKIVLGGDYIGQHSNKQTAITTMQWCLGYYRDLSDYVFPIFGNHDANSNGTTSDVYMSDKETYAVINQWINNEVVYGNNYFDYYWDDEKCNTRYIMVDTGAQSIDGGVIAEATFTWLNEVLNTDKNIVVFAHWLFSPTTWNHPLVEGELVGSYTASATRLFAMLDAKNQNETKVQAIITGHLHCDYDDKTSGGIPIVWTDTDSTIALGEYTATVGTTSEQCFDVMTIDYTNRKIYCDRIGRGISREISY